MLKLEAKQLLLSVIPSTLVIDGHSFAIEKTHGPIPLNKVSLPTINVRFIGEGTPYYRSFDDEQFSYDDVTTYYQNIYTCTIRFTVAAKDVEINTSDTIKYVTGTNIYSLSRAPVLQLSSITSFVKDIDYKLSAGRNSIEWIGNKPTNNTNFTVNYTWVNSGIYINHQLTSYLMKDVRGRIFDLLKQYNIDIVDVKGVVDNSDIYVDDVLSVLTFDIDVTYPFMWSTTVSEEDGVIADTINLELYVNSIDVGTINYTKN